MTYHIPKKKRVVPLNQEEIILKNDYKNNELAALSAIEEYVLNDLPIPNELKDILFEMLDEQSGKREPKKLITEHYRRSLVSSIIFFMFEEGVTQDKAINIVAKSSNINEESLTRYYKDSKYRSFKDALKSTLANAKEVKN